LATPIRNQGWSQPQTITHWGWPWPPQAICGFITAYQTWPKSELAKEFQFIFDILDFIYLKELRLQF
jgi:hypothetical protein